MGQAVVDSFGEDDLGNFSESDAPIPEFPLGSINRFITGAFCIFFFQCAPSNLDVNGKDWPLKYGKSFIRHICMSAGNHDNQLLIWREA